MAGRVNKRMQELQKRLNQLIGQLPDELGNEALNYTLDTFDKEAFGANRWPARKESAWGDDRRTRRGLLIASGRLRRANRLQVLSRNSFAIVNDTEYADVHNQGFIGAVRQNVRSHTRKPRKRAEHTVRSYDRTINQNIPQRQFIGKNAELSQRLQTRFTQLITRLFS